MRLNQWNEALNDFNKAISINAGISETYYQRSWCFSNLGAKELALKDIEKAISMGYPMVDENYYNELKKQVLTPDRPKPLF
jgi:tetratricopeptide (TPR) repeat protein